MTSKMVVNGYFMSLFSKAYFAEMLALNSSIVFNSELHLQLRIVGWILQFKEFLFGGESARITHQFTL